MLHSSYEIVRVLRQHSSVDLSPGEDVAELIAPAVESLIQSGSYSVHNIKLIYKHYTSDDVLFQDVGLLVQSLAILC